MDINLPEQLEEFISRKIDSGLYEDSSEVVRDALRLMEKQDQLHELKIERLREAIRVGDEQASRGEFSTRTIQQIIADNESRIQRDQSQS